jgi:23S rRNA G2445 N2-methylase RlmL
MRYYAQCVAGLQAAVAEQLALARFGPVSIAGTEEGAVLFETAAPPADLRRYPLINNCFLVLEEAQCRTIDELLRGVIASGRWHALARRTSGTKERSFRVMLSDEGALVRADRGATSALIESIAAHTGLRHQPGRADVEFWLIRRRGGRGLFCKRITRRERTERDLERGELRPELAAILCALSEPTSKDVFLDPFAGSGAIPLARARRPYNMIFAFDRASEKVASLKQRIKAARSHEARKKSPIIVRQSKAEQLAGIDDGFIDRIVTDPPWGFFAADVGDIEQFYRDVTLELCRATKPGGVVVMLIGRKDVADRLCAEFAAQLEVAARYDVLVSGKKALVLKWRRRGAASSIDATPGNERPDPASQG